MLLVLREAAAGRADRPTWGQDFPDVVKDIATGQLYIAHLNDDPAGCFVLRRVDRAVWGADIGEARYLHRLATRPRLAGHRIGEGFIELASQMTATSGRAWLRLDCDRNNAALRRYYEHLGFTHVRDVEALRCTTQPGTRDASLYQRTTRPPR